MTSHRYGTYAASSTPTITWKSYKIQQVGPSPITDPINPPEPGRKIDFVLVGNPYVTITGIQGQAAGAIAPDGYSGSGLTNTDGEIVVTLSITLMAYPGLGCILRGTDVSMACDSDAPFEFTK